MSEGAAPRHTNRLIHTTSPYLLQHAHNPVDWYAWGEEALVRARAEDKPILLSIGYSACHWCHVMERESFEDEEIAALMNESFVCVKVDREERPDLDDVYMAATLAMNQGQGGWPMTVFLTPEQEPFFAGTYFPPQDRYGRPGFRTVLARIAEMWRDDRAQLLEQAAEVRDHLRRSAGSAPGSTVGEGELRGALDQLAHDYDARFGGFGPAPKFPPAAALMLLLRLHRRFGDAHALTMVRKTLGEMARGGVYDQVGGGFHRYSVDEQWLVPHFEKMLYDNALLARAYLEGHQATGDPSFGRVTAEVLDYALREMTSPEGAFYSATDADSEGKEGKFFVWTPDEVEAVLGEEDARLFCAYYDITERGNFEGRSIPNTSRTGARLASSLGLSPEALESRVATLKPRVYEARQDRVPPGLDDKVLTAWNGLMIAALAEGARVLGDERYLEAARRAADFVLVTLSRPDGGLFRTYRAGRAHLDGYLEDYAYLCEALVDLYEAGGAARYLQEALRLAERMREDFAAEDGGFYSTAHGHEVLIVRPREGHDGATPSANGTAAHVLARLSFHFDRTDLRESAEAAVRAYARAIARQPRAFAKTLMAVDLLLEGPIELAFVGAPASLSALRAEVARHFLPNRIVAHHDPAEPPSALPLLAGKEPVDGRAALYVCRNFACRRPVTDPSEVPAALEGSAAPQARHVLGSPLAGAATAEGTRAQASGFPPQAYGPLGSTGLLCSRVGFGGYRVDDETPEHREALRLALVEGCNLIDTSTNYTDGGSERLIGEVLAEQVRKRQLPREAVIVVSKIGYVQGENLRLARERAAAGRPFPEVVEYGEGIWHCVHPEFLEDQLSRSLDRLGLETLDVCLLHNPEYFLKDAHERSHGTLDNRREEFERRVREAFRHLEAEVERGRIRWYGVSSNTFGQPAGDPEATSLTRMLEAAREVGGPDHHLRVIQLPLNLFEPGPALERNNGPELLSTVLELAAQGGMGVLVNRPLNAIVGEGMLRLAEVEVGEPEVDLDDQLRRVKDLEAAYRDEIAASLRGAPGSMGPDDFFRWGEELSGLPARLRGLEHWENVQQQVVLPRLLPALQAIDRAVRGSPLAGAWSTWRERYLSELHALMGEIRRQAARHSEEATRAVAEAIDPLLPPERRGESLSRKAIWVAASTPGVSCVLNGMRTPAYVRDALGLLSWPPLPDALGVYERVRAIALPLTASV